MNYRYYVNRYKHVYSRIRVILKQLLFGRSIKDLIRLIKDENYICYATKDKYIFKYINGILVMISKSLYLINPVIRIVEDNKGDIDYNAYIGFYINNDNDLVKYDKYAIEESIKFYKNIPEDKLRIFSTMINDKASYILIINDCNPCIPLEYYIDNIMVKEIEDE